MRATSLLASYSSKQRDTMNKNLLITTLLAVTSLLGGVLAGCPSNDGGAADTDADTSVQGDTSIPSGDIQSDTQSDTDPQDIADSADSSVPHGKLTRTVDVAGVSRQFLVHVPDQVDGSSDVPLVVMIHGTSGDGLKFYNISGWVDKADTEGFIVAFPSALVYCMFKDENHDGVKDPGELKVTSKWAAGSLGSTLPLCTPEERGQHPQRGKIEMTEIQDDVAFFHAMTAAIQAALPIDATRMYATGFSNGAAMSGRLLLEMSDVFAAFGLAAGGLETNGVPKHAAPLVYSVGNRDENILANLNWGRDASDTFSELPMEESLITIAGLEASLAGLLTSVELDSTQYTFATKEIGGATVMRFTYATSTGGNSNKAVVSVIEGLEHKYPNGTNHPVVMADLLWKFFSGYTLE